MKQFEYEYRVVRPGCNYPTYTEFFEQDVYMCSYAEPLSYYADHFVYNGEDPLNNQCLTLVGWGVHLLGLDSDTFYIYHVAAVMVDNLRRLLLGINLSDKAIMDFDFPGVGFPV